MVFGAIKRALGGDYNEKEIRKVTPIIEEVNALDRKDYPERGARLMARGINALNRGLRAYYFGLATLAWFLGPIYLAAAAVWVVAVVYRRDFRSVTLRTLTRDDSSAEKGEGGGTP